MRLVAYLRASTREQSDAGMSLAAQRKTITAWARDNKHRIVSFHADAGVSGALPAEDRPALTEALHRIRAGKASGLIVRDLDRLARSVTVQEAILAQIWSWDSLKVFTTYGMVQRDDPDDPMRTAMREMAGVFAGLERRMIVKRLKDGRAAKAAKGGYTGGAPPYGYRVEKGSLVADPPEQRALARMHELWLAGGSTRDIATTLAAEGHPTKRNGSWTSPVVARILSRGPSTDD